jgi:pimeloyl-ACP methyl ester carboxylesterase
MDVLITIHGVESVGLWQSQVHAEFSGIEDFFHHPHTYGPFYGPSTLSKSERDTEIADFFTFYSQVRERHQGVVPSVIAHSFGTYIVSRALVLFPLMELDRLVLCGSIVATDYDWTARRVSAVRNEIAGDDAVVSLFRSPHSRKLIPDSGPSGVDGFSTKSEKLHEAHFPAYGHSGYFVTNEHCRESWIPFVRGTERFRQVCRACLGQPMEPSVQTVFTREYEPLIERALAVLLPQSVSAETRDALAKIAREHVLKTGSSGRYPADKAVLKVCHGIRDACYPWQSGKI